ncbi:carbohydrate esterase family 1 protein [Annulohypoxylon maeteangense]|uniref:carbohydrate esterase family 1 protein n=1 Tax=Annulohypoxylon maeteangense TaxID=1927788 RepID=UPI0020082395|nr:carbohydrate esterase family 1 protein [Annulohypoxylon maeteangense]KAI0889380.1 carbohydrate esterase family 1 protein [Annulohypoxylon maeteangense]
MHPSLLSTLTSLLALSPTLTTAASLQKITSDIGPNPRKVGFYIYVPDKLAASPPILVNPHWCHGDAQACYSGSQYATLASKYGFIVIYPDSPNTADKCWDVSSNETHTHDAGGDSLGIASMVRWTLDKYKGDAKRVFVTGVSSGAMMTSLLLGAYPDIFAAGSAFAGVPYGCFAGNGYGVWSDACATGKVKKTGAEWAAMVKAGYAGYTGWRPKIQIFHGTNDEVLNYANFEEEIKEWTAVLGFNNTPTTITANTPVNGWTKNVYGDDDWFEAYSAAGVPHNIQNQEATAMAWFDLTCTGDNCFKWGQGGPALN